MPSKKADPVKGHASYNVWMNMLKRCLNPKVKSYPDYGGRGITVCPEWMDFRGFLADMGDPPEGMMLDRRDNNRGYCKENCRWVTRKEQNNNKRNNRLIEHDGRVQTITDWARELGVDRKTLEYRIVKKGWSLSRALTEPAAPTRIGRLITFEGRTMSIRAWSRELGVSRRTLSLRLAKNKPLSPKVIS